MTQAISLSITAEHPALPGHFPGQPIVPGVVILDNVLAAIEYQQPNLSTIGFRKVKFLQPLFPGQTFTLQYQAPLSGRIKINCALGASPLLEATLLYDTLLHENATDLIEGEPRPMQ